MNTSTFATRGFEWLVLTELMLVSVIIAVTLAILLPYREVALFKARFTEALIALSIERNHATEHFAHAGAWSGGDDAKQAAAGVAQPKPGADHVNVAVAEGGVVAAGTLRGRSFVLGMRPAVPSLSENWSVLWLCGARQAPAGWQVPPVHAPGNLPMTHLPLVCRPEWQR